MKKQKPRKPIPWKKILFWLFLAGHSVLLVGLTFWLLSLDFMRGKEALLLKSTAGVVNTLLPEPDKPDVKEFAFINVAYDKELITREDENGWPAGNEPITDRAKLARVFHVLNENPNYKFLICDINFQGDSPNDAALEKELNQLPNAIFSYHLNDSGGKVLPKFPNIRPGLTDYAAVDRDFLKFRLVRNGEPTLPLIMYQELEGGTFEPGGLMWRLNGKPAFNDFVLDFRIRPYDLFRDTLAYPYDDLFFLDELITYQQNEQIHAYTQDRIIVVGDFEVGDMHPTMYGEMAGPLILANVYLALKNGDNELSWGFPLLLFAVYLLLSYIVYTQRDFFESFVRNKIAKGNIFIQVLTQGITYLLILALTSILSFLLFNHYINFLILALYFNLVEIFRKWYFERKERKAERT